MVARRIVVVMALAIATQQAPVKSGEVEYCPPFEDTDLSMHKIKGFKTSFEVPKKTWIPGDVQLPLFDMRYNGTKTITLFPADSGTGRVPRRGKARVLMQDQDGKTTIIARDKAKRGMVDVYGGRMREGLQFQFDYEDEVKEAGNFYWMEYWFPKSLGPNAWAMEIKLEADYDR